MILNNFFTALFILIFTSLYSQNTDTIFVTKNNKLYYSVYKRDSSEGYIFKISNYIKSDTIWKIDNLISNDWKLYIKDADKYLNIKFDISLRGKLTYVINNIHRNFVILNSQTIRLNDYPIQGQNVDLYIKRETEEYKSKNGNIELKNNF